MKKNRVVLVLISFVMFNCQMDKNSEEFTSKIIDSHKECIEKHNCTIDFKSLFPFKWEKIYVFSNENYPEANSSSISNITGVYYNGNREYLKNRSILFINKDKVVYEILTSYEADGYIDNKLMDVGFVYNVYFPKYFSSNNAKFKIHKHDNGSLSLEHLN